VKVIFRPGTASFKERIWQGWRSAWKPADRRPPWQWCEDNVRVDDTSPFPGKWRSDNSPWVREFMETFSRNDVSEIAVMCSAQSAKTQTIMCLLMWALKEDPGPTQYVMAAHDEVKTFSRTRLHPTIDNTPAVRELVQGELGISEMDFPGAALLLTGANSKSKLQSNPKRYLFLDEVRNYPPGAYEMVRKRVRAFWNSKVLVISTPGKVNDHVHRAFLDGDQRRWHFACPCCGQLQELSFKQLRWDTTEKTKPGGRWNFDEVYRTVRYEGTCGCILKDEPATRLHIANVGRWIRTNPSAASDKVSFTWNAMLPPWVKWQKVVEEFIVSWKALKLGDHEPYKAFINETLGEPWEDRLKEYTDFGHLEARRREYAIGDAAPDELTRFLAVDVQKDHFRYVCRAFGPLGASRLIAFGRVDTEGDLEALPVRLNVKAVNVMVDSGHEAPKVYRLCARNPGWKAFKGNGSEWFHGTDPVTDKPVRKLFSRSEADPGLGTRDQGRRKIRLYLWSNPGIKDILAEHMLGLGPDWTIPNTNSPEMDDYLAQISSEKRIEKTDARGRVSYEWVQIRRDNHYWDCECMILVAAMISGAAGISTEAKSRGAAAPNPPAAPVAA
jgi:phage terminase large subunit GpA-like protein